MANEDIFLGSGASLTFVPEQDIYVKPASVDATKTTLTPHSDFTGKYKLVPNLYVGCKIDYYDNTTYESSHIITSNTTSAITFEPAIDSGESSGNYLDTTNDYFIIRGYGAPCPAPFEATSNELRLNADNWLGLVEAATFPNVEVEMKQMNLALGGTRNYTYQFKGIETSSGGNLGFMSNQATWLYYFFGKLDSITHSANTGVTADSYGSGEYFTAPTADSYFIEVSPLSTGPIFYRSIGTVSCPPVLRSFDSETDMKRLIRTTTNGTALTDPILYTFSEQNGEDLPSFALEHTLSKLDGTSNAARDTSTLYHTEGATTETKNFVRIARGNRVNTLTMTANENEELKITLDLNTRTVDDINSLCTTEVYEARNGVEAETSFQNYNATTNDRDTFLEPFFFSDGYFKAYGQQFLKITNFTLTMNNNLQDKRFVGAGSKSIKSAIPAQRTYELSFTALVTDDTLFQELRNSTENLTQDIELKFTKDNGEYVELKFQDYFTTSNTWTIPDDKGPITVEATIMPRTMSSCKVNTHWVLQG